MTLSLDVETPVAGATPVRQPRAAVLGLDLSLTATGISNGRCTSLIQHKRLAGIDRIRWIADQIVAYLDGGFDNPTIAIEGPAYAATTGSQHERGGLWWHVVDKLDGGGFSIIVVPPSVLKKYATGKGNAGKDAVLLAAARRFDWFKGDNNESDALFLAAIAGHLTGQPIVQMPAAHTDGIGTKVSWVRRPRVAA